jgi:GH15 family glucan-1,4-alpha-glucosidase
MGMAETAADAGQAGNDSATGAASGATGAASAYSPIEDYGAIGNLRTVALVSRQGSIDWCCLPQLDCSSVFGAILDHRQGGRFRCAPAGSAESGEQRYLEGTNVLETTWVRGAARLTVTDFMPLRGSIIGTGHPPTAPHIHRILRCEGGDCDVAVEWSPRFDFARAPMRMEAAAGEVVAEGGSERISLLGLPGTPEIEDDGHGPVARATLTLRAGDVVPLLTCLGDGADACTTGWEEELRHTCEAWRQWAESRDEPELCDFAGRWQPLLDRSGLALKLLTYPATGAIAAAATTSLPEHIGGVRNWDYRYTWIRDASFTADAFVALGHRTEAIDFLEWAERFSMREDGEHAGLNLMYTLDGNPDIPEEELPHLEGYRESRPVRVGNKASQQFQLDIFGELLDAAYALVRLGAEVDDELWTFLTKVADEACARWQEKDLGIWEVRSDPQHFVHSKLMVWVALDRALRLAARLKRSGSIDAWRASRDAVREWILEHGYDPERGAFVQSAGSRALDAANLLIPVVGFLPADDERVQNTIDLSLKELTENGLVYRYLTDDTDDGLPGEEGAFGLTTFWMIDALALSGRLDEARSMFEGIAARANHVGLYSEEFDPRSGGFLGNFPQAFTHIGLINSAIYIAHAEGRDIPSPAPIGTPGAAEETDADGEAEAADPDAD